MEKLKALRAQIGDRQLAYLAAMDGADVKLRLLALAVDDDRYMVEETMAQAVSMLMGACWGEGFQGDATDFVALQSHLVQKILTMTDHIHWKIAESCLAADGNERERLLVDWSDEARDEILACMKWINAQRAWRERFFIRVIPEDVPKQVAITVSVAPDGAEDLATITLTNGAAEAVNCVFAAVPAPGRKFHPCYMGALGSAPFTFDLLDPLAPDQWRVKVNGVQTGAMAKIEFAILRSDQRPFPRAMALCGADPSQMQTRYGKGDVDAVLADVDIKNGSRNLDRRR